MVDETNPRSLDFQLEHLVDLYEKLPRYDPSDLKTMQDALDTLRGIDLQAMLYPAPDKPDRRDGWHCGGWTATSATWKTCCPPGPTISPAATSAMRAPCRSPWDNDVGMLYKISHRTTYKYGSPVSVGITSPA